MTKNQCFMRICTSFSTKNRSVLVHNVFVVIENGIDS